MASNLLYSSARRAPALYRPVFLPMPETEKSLRHEQSISPLRSNAMEESKRQKQVAGLIQSEMSDIFQREGIGSIGGGLLSISRVAVTPDLMEARIYLSFFQVKQPDEALKSIRERTGEWRGELGRRVRNQLRRVPELQFFPDDTLDHVFKMEELFKKIEDERKGDS